MIDVVCGVIQDTEGRYLACLRPKGKHLAGLWEFPGGKIEHGEDPEFALARELEEELSIHVRIESALQPVEWTYDYNTIRLIPYRCRIIGGQLQANEHEKTKWCIPEDFDSMDWAEADLPILRQLTRESTD